MIDLTGGEPLLRSDLEEICASFDDRSCIIVGTTGWGLTPARARSLRASGVFGMGISLDSTDKCEHDRLRGRNGAFRATTQALANAKEAGLYPYIVAVATREFLERDRFDARSFRIAETSVLRFSTRYHSPPEGIGDCRTGTG